MYDTYVADFGFHLCYSKCTFLDLDLVTVFTVDILVWS